MAQPRDQRFDCVNLQSVIERHIWNRFRSEAGFLRRLFMRKNNYRVDIRWGFMDFQHETTRHDVRPDIEEDVTGGKPIALFMSEFENKTPVEQSYTFNTTRHTKTSATVEFQENYSMGTETKLELKIPGDILAVSAGINGSLEVTETESQTYEDVLSWSVDTQITVKRGHKAKAKLCVHEKTSIVDFEVETTLSLPKGKLPVAIRKKSDDSIVFTTYITNLKPLFAKLGSDNLRINEVVTDKTVQYNVVLVSKGVCKSVAWKNQFVEVESEQIVDLPGSEED